MHAATILCWGICPASRFRASLLDGNTSITYTQFRYRVARRGVGGVARRGKTLAGQLAATSYSRDLRIEASPAWSITLSRSISSRFTLPLEANRAIYASASALAEKFFRFPCTLSLLPRKSSASHRKSETRFAISTRATTYYKFSGLENETELHSRGYSAPVQQENHAKKKGQRGDQEGKDPPVQRTLGRNAGRGSRGIAEGAALRICTTR